MSERPLPNPNTEPQQRTPEKQEGNPFDVLTPENLDEIRKMQLDFFVDKMLQPESRVPSNEPIIEAMRGMQDLREKILADYGITPDQQWYKDIDEVLADTISVTDKEWNEGVKDESGNKVEPSGREKAMVDKKILSQMYGFEEKPDIAGRLNGEPNKTDNDNNTAGNQKAQPPRVHTFLPRSQHATKPTQQTQSAQQNPAGKATRNKAQQSQQNSGQPQQGTAQNTQGSGSQQQSRVRGPNNQQANQQSANPNVQQPGPNTGSPNQQGTSPNRGRNPNKPQNQQTNPNQQQPNPNQQTNQNQQQSPNNQQTNPNAANPNQQGTNPNQQQNNPNVYGDPSKVTPEMMQVFNELNATRHELARLSAKRQGRLVGGRNEEFDRVQYQYNRLMHQYILDVMKWQGVDQKPPVERNAFVTAHILDQSMALRGETIQRFENTAIMKFSRWLARGNLAQRVVKGAVIGATGVLVGGALTAATGGAAAALFGGLTTAAVAGGMTRGMRGYASSRGRMQNGPLSQDQMHAIHNTELIHHDNYGNINIFNAIGTANEQVEHSIRGEQKANRRAAAVGAFAVAAGTLASEVAAPAIHGLMDSLTHTAGTPEVAHALGGLNNSPNVHPSVMTDTLSDHLTPNQLSAFNIGNGEGGFELMHNLGHGATEWLGMQDHLLQTHPGDFYRMPDGNVGLRHPGQLSNAAINDISQRLGLWH